METAKAASARTALKTGPHCLTVKRGLERAPATRAGLGSALAYRSALPPHCPGPEDPLLYGFQSWHCRYAAIEMYFSAKHIPGEVLARLQKRRVRQRGPARSGEQR